MDLKSGVSSSMFSFLIPSSFTPETYSSISTIMTCRLATGLLWDERDQAGIAFLSGLWGAAVWEIAQRYLEPCEWERLHRVKDLRIWMTLQNTFVPLKKLSRKICGHSRKNKVEAYKRPCWNLVEQLKPVCKVVILLFTYRTRPKKTIVKSC